MKEFGIGCPSPCSEAVLQGVVQVNRTLSVQSCWESAHALRRPIKPVSGIKALIRWNPQRRRLLRGPASGLQAPGGGPRIRTAGGQ